MNTDYLDLVQFHGSPTPEQLRADGGFDALIELKREGKVRHIGMSGTLPNLPAQIEMGVFEAFQVPYSAIQREHESVIAKASASGAGVVIRGGAARGAPFIGNTSLTASFRRTRATAGRTPGWRTSSVACHRWSLRSGSRSRTPISIPPSSGRATRLTCAPTSKRPLKGHCRKRSWPKPSAVWQRPVLLRRPK